ncbi:ABC transporter permease subunit [Fodinibius sediminis]|uniref:Cu-processing system permease protein n=1 Tax=Fodinibius sediminis TaxID=1214077 RepID=A0A521BLE8_9BACT|nr:ABC transporter permease subunit [Fodinibius sediminis]SMO47977.1 Cu-processing system permease protein [Fodinibius sediminis]
MKTLTILKYQWKDLFRGKWIIGYGLIYLLVADAMIRFGGTGPKAMLSIANVMLLLIPLVGMIYGALYLYQSREFTELLLAQPLNRRTLFWGLFGGVAMPLALAFSLGVGLPMLYSGIIATSPIVSVLLVLVLGNVLTLLFTGLGFWLALAFFNDRIKGLGFALVSWLFLAILYDGLVLLTIVTFGDYPIEKPMLALALINPIDLARITVLLNFDVSALMGYTGAVFSRFFGSMLGMSVAAGCLMIWLGLPLWRSVQLFKKKDF